MHCTVPISVTNFLNGPRSWSEMRRARAQAPIDYVFRFCQLVLKSCLSDSIHNTSISDALTLDSHKGQGVGAGKVDSSVQMAIPMTTPI